MTNRPDFIKTCSRCPLPVRMTREQYQIEHDQQQTTCDRCKAILEAEANEVLARLAISATCAPPAPAALAAAAWAPWPPPHLPEEKPAQEPQPTSP